MIKIAFCDDDAAALSQLSDLFEQYRLAQSCPIQIGAFDSAAALMNGIEHGCHWDILLLDILMPQENGISLAARIRDYDQNVKIIFLTSSPEFAVQSYSVNATFYLLKPITAEGLFPVLDKTVKLCRQEKSHALIVKCKNGITTLSPDQLEYCEVIGRSLIFHMSDGSILESVGTLDELEHKLAEQNCFLRVHRSYLINMAYMKTISSRFITLAGLAEIPIPRGKYALIKEAYLQYAFENEQVIL